MYIYIKCLPVTVVVQPRLACSIIIVCSASSNTPSALYVYMKRRGTDRARLIQPRETRDQQPKEGRTDGRAG